MDDSQRIALENSPQIAKIIANHQNFRRYCRKAILYPIWISLDHAPSAYTCTVTRIALQHILPASAKMFGSSTRCRRKMRRVYHSLKLTRCVYSSRRGTDVTDNYTRQLPFRSSCAIAPLSC